MQSGLELMGGGGDAGSLSLLQFVLNFDDCFSVDCLLCRD